MKKLGKYGKKVSCVVIGMLCAAAIGACGSTQSGSQDEKDVRNDISVYEEGADLEGTLTYGTLFIEPQTQHMIDLFMKEHPGVKIETKVVFDNDVTDEQYNEGLNTLLTELASDQRADIYDATYLPSEIKTKGSGYFEDLNQYIVQILILTEMIITIISCEQQKSVENCIKFRKVFIMLCFG